MCYIPLTVCLSQETVTTGSNQNRPVVRGGAVPAAEQVSVVVSSSLTVFAVSPESVMITFDGGAATRAVIRIFIDQSNVSQIYG